MFPQVGEWRGLYGRLPFYFIISACFCLLFWLWHFSLTGEDARNSWGIARFSDSLSVSVWMLLLVVGARFAQYVHVQPRLKDKWPTHLISWARRWIVYYFALGIIWVSIYDVWLGSDILSASLVVPFLLVPAFIIYWWLALPLMLLRWFEAR